VSEPLQPSESEVKEILEDLAAAALFDLLRDRGHAITEVRWPDRERRGAKGGAVSGAKTPDLTFREDGRLVGVDIMELYESARHARQNSEMGRMVGRLEDELRPMIRELSPGNTIAISWSVRWLPPSASIRAGLDVVRDTILAAAADIRPGETVDLQPKPDFIEELQAICYVASSNPTFGFFSMHEEQTSYVLAQAASMAESLLTSSKPEQLQGFEDARVVAIDRTVMPFPEDMRAVIAERAERIPENWTTIYYVLPWRERPTAIHEVWERRPPHVA
jgi:hypothetical protein